MAIKAKRKTMLPSKISQQKRYEYIKKIEVDGYPRIRAYAEVIDPKIYDLTPKEIDNRIVYLKDAWKDYDELREMVLAEQQDWNLRRSAIAQDKAIELLTVTLDKAIEMVRDPECDNKSLAAAVSTLKTIMPAFTKKEQGPVEHQSVNVNAAKYIN